MNNPNPNADPNAGVFKTGGDPQGANRAFTVSLTGNNTKMFITNSNDSF